MAVARNSGQAAMAGERARSRAATPGRGPKTPLRPRGVPTRESAAPSLPARPAFHERSLVAEGLAAAFRIDAGSGWATGSLPAGAGENEIAKFLGEAMGFAKQMQAAMGGSSGTAAVEILIADSHAGAARQSALQVAMKPEGGADVTVLPGSNAGHLAAMLQHFLMR